MAALVLREDRDGLVTLSLNRPDKLNALTIPLFEELDAHLADIETRKDSVGLVVLRGVGKGFCAGNDLTAIRAVYTPPRPNFQSTVVERLADLPQPVIVAVHGACYTGGLELALAGDLILAAQSARFADTHAKWSLAPVWGMSQRLPRRIGLSKAREMMLTSRTYNGEQALAMGLANWCVPDADFDAAVSATAAEMLALSWHSLRANKALLRDTDGLSLKDGLAHEVYRSAGVGGDMADRIASFAARKSA